MRFVIEQAVAIHRLLISFKNFTVTMILIVEFYWLLQELHKQIHYVEAQWPLAHLPYREFCSPQSGYMMRPAP
jgi:hypothetical protein